MCEEVYNALVPYDSNKVITLLHKFEHHYNKLDIYRSGDVKMGILIGLALCIIEKVEIAPEVYRYLLGTYVYTDYKPVDFFNDIEYGISVALRCFDIPRIDYDFIIKPVTKVYTLYVPGYSRWLTDTGRVAFVNPKLIRLLDIICRRPFGTAKYIMRYTTDTNLLSQMNENITTPPLIIMLFNGYSIRECNILINKLELDTTVQDQTGRCYNDYV